MTNLTKNVNHIDNDGFKISFRYFMKIKIISADQLNEAFKLFEINY